jgi:hypothetical protein
MRPPFGRSLSRSWRTVGPAGLRPGAKRSQLKTKAPSTSIGTQIKVYALSALLPPFGLLYVWRYYKQSDPASQRIASIALVLTILMTAASVWITIDTLNAVNRMLNAALNGSID